MGNKEEEYKEMFLAEALENFGELNRLLTVLEKSPKDRDTVHTVFRITHTLKGNATGMGYGKIAEMSHVLEDFFGEVRDGKIEMNADIFSTVFRAADTLGELINAIKEPKEVKYRGIKTKLEVIVNLNRKMGSAQSGEGPSVAEGSKPSPQGDGQGNGEESAEAPEDDGAVENENKVTFSDLVQVPVRKLDNLLDLVGELLIERDRIIAAMGGRAGRANEFTRLNRISSDLQYSVMDVRLVQVGFLFNKFHRIVRDAAAQEKKKVRLKLEGADTEIDRNVLQVISDSLIHLIRNAVGHGIESPEERKRNNKEEEGTIVLKAGNETDTVLIEITDDGSGIDADRVRSKAIGKGLVSAEECAQLSDRDVTMLIFEPGFSTMDQVTSISGRGVGMDVVKRAMDSIGGTIEVNTMKGQGTRLTLRLPSSMAVKSTLLFELGQNTYAIPLGFTESVLSLYRSKIHRAAGGLVAVHLNRTISIVFLSQLFEQPGTRENAYDVFDSLHPEQKLEIVVVQFNGRYLGLVVDKLLQQKEIVEKPLRKPVDQVRYVSGTTILGNGSVCMVLNIPNIIQGWYGQLSVSKFKTAKHTPNG